MEKVSAWSFGIGIMWLTWNLLTSAIGAMIGSELIANSPFAANATTWLLSLGLIGLGIVTNALTNKKK
jgi:hypothetical protein